MLSLPSSLRRPWFLAVITLLVIASPLAFTLIGYQFLYAILMMSTVSIVAFGILIPNEFMSSASMSAKGTMTTAALLTGIAHFLLGLGLLLLLSGQFGEYSLVALLLSVMCAIVAISEVASIVVRQ